MTELNPRLQKFRIIEEINIVRDDYIPFVCPVCDNQRKEEYIRIYTPGSPNGLCIHSRCLMSLFRKAEERRGPTPTS